MTDIELIKSVAGIAGAPLVVAFVEIVKRTFPEMQARFYPAIAMATGVVWNLLATAGIVAMTGGGSLAVFFVAGLAGLITGAVASGAFQYGKTREQTTVK